MKTDIKALKMRVDLVAMIQAHGVPLKQKGANFVARCPFKTEKTASFTVSPAKRIWKCFGCGVGGDVFKFLELKEKLTLPQAIERVRVYALEVPPAATSTPATGLTTTLSPVDAPAVDRPPQVVLDRVITQWQKMLAHTAKAQAYLKARGLWHPELLRALRVGYASGSVARSLPGGGKLRRQLTQMGILNAKGSEFFYNRIVIPIVDAAGVLVNVYGRSLDPENECPHLYLRGPQRGVFNRAGVADASQVILTEAPLDALSLLALGFPHTTTSYGANGFPADLRAELVRSKAQRVYCVYDPDPAGDQAADQLAHDLAAHGIEVLRVILPGGCKDPNDFLRSSGTREQFQAFMDAARAIPVPRPATAPQFAPQTPPPAPAAGDPVPPTAPLTAPVPATSASPEVPIPPPLPQAQTPAALELVLGERTYQLEGEPVRSGETLRVRVRVTRGDRRWVETFNVYSPHGRSVFLRNVQTAFRGQVSKKTLEDDFFAVFDAIEERAGAPSAPDSAPLTPTMTPVDHDEALAFLKRPDLIDVLLEDLVRLGVVGEDDNKLLAYLVATSRRLGRPLSLSVISRASAGKSWLLNVVLNLMPPEDVLRYTRMSPRALFYVEAGRFKHKILFIEEAIGAKDADLGVRSIQSEQRIANMVTTTDPKTGQLKTQETVVEGPLTYITSSVEQLDFETATRSFEIAIDESTDQTARVLERQFHERTVEGFREKLTSHAILRRHQNAQRLLEPLWVANPYAPQLTFPSGTLRTRRECGKYLSLMETLAFLQQHQRPIRTLTHEGATHRYVEVTRDDVERANRLMASCLSRALSDLSGPAENLLLAIRDYVTAEADARGTEPLAITFSRRQIRECVDCPDEQALPLLEEIVKREYIETVAGSFGKRYVYTLTPDHRLIVRAGLSIPERIVAMGLKPADQLVDPATFRSRSDLRKKR